MLDRIPTLLICFENELALAELPLFRGAVASKVPPQLVLFHNHEGNSLRYRYPLIQYKRIGGKAAILCLGDGTDEISEFFEAGNLDFHIGNRDEAYKVERMAAGQWLLQVWNTEFTYTIRKWLPFNSENYAAYQQLTGLAERATMLEHILVGNMLSMCTGLGVHLEKQITCTIRTLSEPRLYRFKGVKMQGVDVVFRTNLYMPDYVGLGKGVSHGFGMIHRAREGKQTETKLEEKTE